MVIASLDRDDGALTGFASAASAASPFSMKNAPAPPPPSTTTASTMIISIFLDFFGASRR